MMPCGFRGLYEDSRLEKRRKMNKRAHYKIERDGLRWAVAGVDGEIICQCQHRRRAKAVVDGLELLWRSKQTRHVNIPPTHEGWGDVRD